ncbi:N-acetyltransferase [Acinetobacter sp. Marseille-Q1618]|uniref:GNAT family N-acetyltransferase n=1 Tax=Acinetobacter sp. Marseille-Q1618 TaxID=2697502 RepID=UPI0015700463|nr:GNAT family N-acetyltransferase [Acinetobacter sp. Marseille-Q1618]
MTEILIRQLNDNDVHDFRAIRLSALQNSPEMFGATYAVEVTRPLSIFLDVIFNNVVFAAYHHERIIGVLIFQQNIDQANLYGFFVEPEYRNQGVAQQLLQTTIDYGQAYVRQVILSVVATNIPAIHLYQKLGFQIVTQAVKNNEHEIEMMLFY